MQINPVTCHINDDNIFTCLKYIMRLASREKSLSMNHCILFSFLNTSTLIGQLSFPYRRQALFSMKEPSLLLIFLQFFSSNIGEIVKIENRPASNWIFFLQLLQHWLSYVPHTLPDGHIMLL